MKTIHLLIISCLLVYSGIMQAQISGPSETDLFDTVTFINAYGPCNNDCDSFYWIVSGSYVIISQSETQLQVYWITDGIETVELWVMDGSEEILADEKDIKAGDPVKIRFSYDAAGNRTGREIVYLTLGGTKSLEYTKTPEPEEEIEPSDEIRLYPNPFREVVFIALDEEAFESEKKYVELYDNLGRLRKTILLTDYVNEIPASDIPNGTYILKLTYDNHHKEWILIKN